MRCLSQTGAMTPLILLLLALNWPAKTLGQGCHHESYDPTGAYETPGYPDAYPNGVDCSFKFFTDKMIDVHFESFAVEESADCTYDYLNVIFDAISQNAKPERYCGDGLQNVNDGHLRGVGPLVMMFRSDDGTALGGFKFTYQFELFGEDPCLSDPCQNEGTCERLTDDYRCLCEDGYAGDHCEIEIDECASHPCRNGGVCQDEYLGFTCECVDDFTGDTCETAPSRCESNPCLNDGICVNRITDFVCSCPLTHYGDFCEIEVTTTPAPTTTTTTIATTLPDATSDPKTGSNDDNGESGQTRNGDPKSNVDMGDAPDNSAGSSGGAVGVVIIILVSIAVVALMVWCWLKQQRKRSDAISEDSLADVRNKSNKRHKENSKETQRKLSHSNDDLRYFDLLNELQRISQEVVTDKDSETNANKKKKRHKEDNGKMKHRRKDKNLNRVPTPYTDSIISYDEGNARNYDPKKDSNTIHESDISPEKAARILNQLLGKKRPRHALTPQDAHQAMQHVKQKQIHQGESISIVSSDGDDRQKEFQRKKKLKGRQARSIQKVPNDSPIQEESSMSERECEGNESLRRQTALIKRALRHQKTWENSRRASLTIESDDGSDSSLSGPRRGREKPHVIETDVTLGDLGIDDDKSTAVPSAFRPIHRNPYNPPPLPITENKAKSLVDKLVRAPVHSNQNYVGPALGVQRERAFMS